MLSKNQIKNITQLKQKKYRLKNGFFVAEGIKTITELLNSNLDLHHLYSTTNTFGVLDVLRTKISDAELKKISFFTTPNTALAIFKIPKPKPINTGRLIIALDDVRDPGNLGTIIRLCDWFGIEDLICNSKTVDCYNPKVIQATMGSISRINISYLNLETYLETQNKGLIFGTFMSGKNIYSETLPETGIVILGNEANGISKAISKLITHKISIPRFGTLKATESLNVANATAIILSEFKRLTAQ